MVLITGDILYDMPTGSVEGPKFDIFILVGASDGIQNHGRTGSDRGWGWGCPRVNGPPVRYRFLFRCGTREKNLGAMCETLQKSPDEILGRSLGGLQEVSGRSPGYLQDISGRSPGDLREISGRSPGDAVFLKNTS